MNWLGYLVFLPILFFSFILVPLIILFVYSTIYYIKITLFPMDQYQYIQDNIIDTQLISFSKNFFLVLTIQASVFSAAFTRFIKLLFELRIAIIVIIIIFFGMFIVNEYQEEFFTATDKFYKDFFSIVVRPLVVSLLNIVTFLYDFLSPVVNFIAALLNYPLRALLYIVRYCEPRFIINLFKTLAEFVLAVLRSFFSWAEQWFFFAPLDLKTPTSALLLLVKDINNFEDCTCQSVGDLFSIVTEGLTKDYLPLMVNGTFNSIWCIPRIPVTSFYNKKRPDFESMTISLIETVNHTALLSNFILSRTIPKLINTLDKNLFPLEIMDRIENAFLPGILFAPIESLLSVSNSSINLIFHIDIFAIGIVDAFHSHPNVKQKENIENSKNLLNLEAAFNLLRQFTSIIEGFFDLFFKTTKFDFIKYPFMNISKFIIDYAEYLWNFFVTILFNGFSDPLENIRVNIWYTDQTDNIFLSLNDTINSIIFVPSQFIETFIPGSNETSKDGTFWVAVLRDVHAFVYLITEILSSIVSIVINGFHLYIDFQLNFDNFIKYVFCPYTQGDTEYCRGSPLQYDYIMNRNSSFNVLLDEIESDLDGLAVKTGSLLYFTNTKQCRGNFMSECNKFSQEIECYLGDIIITTLELAIYVLKYLINVFKGIYSLNIFEIIPDWKNSIRPRIIKVVHDINSIVFYFLTFAFKSYKCGKHCIALDLAKMATDFFKFFLIVFDMIFTVLNAISSYVSQCDIDRTQCNFDLSPLVKVILQDSFGVVIDVLDSASDIYICLGGGSDNAFHLLAQVFQGVSDFLNTALNGFFVEIMQFVFSILTGDFFTAFEALYKILIGIMTDILRLLFLIIEEIVKVAFEAIFSPIIQNDFMCVLCEIFAIVTRIVTWDSVKIHCDNYCKPKACYNDTLNSNSPKCPQPKNKHKKGRSIDDDEYSGDVDSNLNINEMITFIKQQEYIKKNQDTLNRHAKSLNQYSQTEKEKTVLEKRKRKYDEYDEKNTGLLDQIKDSRVIGRLFRVLVDSTIQTDSGVPKITKESCIYSLYSLRNRTLPSVFTKMSKEERIDFKQLTQVCSVVENIFDLSTIAEVEQPDDRYFSKLQPKSSCDEWITLLNKTNIEDTFYTENINKKMIEIHATSCIKERVLVSFINKFILQLGERFRPLFLSKDFFSDPLIASTDIMKIMFNIFNTSGIFPNQIDNNKFKDLVSLTTKEEKHYQREFKVPEKEKALQSVSKGDVSMKKRDAPNSLLTKAINNFVFGEEPTKVDFCSIQFTSNEYFFSFLTVYCNGRVVIESTSINIELSKYCPYGEMDHDIRPDTIIKAVCKGEHIDHKKNLIEGVVFISKTMKETLSKRRGLQKEFLPTYNEKYFLTNAPPVYWHLREFKNSQNRLKLNTEKKHTLSTIHPLSINPHLKKMQDDIERLKLHRMNMDTKLEKQKKKIKNKGFLIKKDVLVDKTNSSNEYFPLSKEVTFDSTFLRDSSRVLANSRTIFKTPNLLLKRVLIKEEHDKDNPLRGSFTTLSKRFIAKKSQQGFFDCALLDNFVSYIQIESDIINYYFENCFPLYEDYFKSTFNLSQTPVKPICTWPNDMLESPNPFTIKIDTSFLEDLSGNRTSPTRNKTIEMINNNTFSKTTKNILNSFLDNTHKLVKTIVNNLPSEKNQTSLNEKNKNHRDFFWYLKHFLTCDNRGGNFCSIGGLGLRKALLLTFILIIIYLIAKKYFLPVDINILPFAILTILIITWMAAYLYSPFCIPQIPTCFMVDVQEIVLDLIPPYINWGPFLKSSLANKLSKTEGILKKDFYLNRNCNPPNTAPPKCFQNYTSNTIGDHLSLYNIKTCYHLKYATLDYINSSLCQMPEILLEQKERTNTKFLINKEKSLKVNTSDSTIFLICHQEFELIDPLDSLLMASHVYLGERYPLHFLDINIPLFYQIVHSSIVKNKIERYRNPVYNNNSSTTACFYLTSYLLIPIFMAFLLVIFLLVYFGPSTFSLIFAVTPLIIDLYLITTSMCFEVLFRDDFK